MYFLLYYKSTLASAPGAETPACFVTHGGDTLAGLRWEASMEPTEASHLTSALKLEEAYPFTLVVYVASINNLRAYGCRQWFAARALKLRQDVLQLRIIRGIRRVKTR
jgi:hypothetical protein